MGTNVVKHQGGGNIWFGVAVGVLLGSGGLYLLGTEKGRDLLKKIIAIAEEMDLSLEDVVNSVEEIFEDENPVTMSDQNGVLTHSDNLNSVLDKIKHVFPSKPEVKRYFAKEGTIQKGS